MNSTQIIEKTRQIIDSNRYMTLVTCSLEALPWASPVAYAVDSSWIFYWYSAQNAIHSKNISQNRNVSAAIFNSTSTFEQVDGIQMAGLADIVSDLDLPRIHKLYWEHCFPDAEMRCKHERPLGKFLGDEILRFYSYQPLDIWKYDTESTDIDQRIKIDILAL